MTLVEFLRRLLRRGTGGTIPPYKPSNSVQLAQISPGRRTRKRPGETWAEATNRLTEGRDL